MDFTTDLIERTYYIGNCPKCGATAKLNLNKQNVGDKEPIEIETLSILCPQCNFSMSTENYIIDIADIFNLVVAWNGC